MADDEKRDDETTEGQEPQSTGPVAGEDSSSSQAAGEEPAPTPPVEEAPEEPPAEAPQEPESSADESSPEAEEPSEEAEPEAGESEVEAAEETEPEAAVETEAAEEPRPEPAAQEKKKDVIPGADLEPIAVEPEGRELSAEEKARLEAEEEEKARREAALAEAESSDAAASRAPAKMESGARFLATGKRKRSIARVTLLPGDGKFVVNDRSLEEFFPRPLHQTIARQPLAASGYEGNVDVRVRVHGGGISGQAGAVRHGIARALTEIDSELRGDLKRRGFLTRDARVKERRKAGFKKARKKPQFSKR
ncbi:MAG: small subunit ribosomal protein [Solirubrobacterales bacterium]|jgi:small subunit ribosomal protein S9|nr:small subunit ribosomal protein [Solirubrobacterales bacterium]